VVIASVDGKGVGSELVMSLSCSRRVWGWRKAIWFGSGKSIHWSVLVVFHGLEQRRGFGLRVDGKDTKGATPLTCSTQTNSLFLIIPFIYFLCRYL
jgi:hypothetical protein